MKTLKELRQDAGLTQDGLARLISVVVPVSRATVATWENNNVCPEYLIIQRLSVIFVLPIEKIYEIFYHKDAEAK